METREKLTVSQVGDMLGISRVTVWRLLRDGYLKGYQKTPYRGSPWVVYADSVEEFVERRDRK